MRSFLRTTWSLRESQRPTNPWRQNSRRAQKEEEPSPSPTGEIIQRTSEDKNEESKDLWFFHGPIQKEPEPEPERPEPEQPKPKQDKDPEPEQDKDSEPKQDKDPEAEQDKEPDQEQEREPEQKTAIAWARD